MIIEGQELLVAITTKPLKFVVNENGILIFPGDQQHSTVKAAGISYEDHGGNALAGIIKQELVEIRGHPDFSNERVKSLWTLLASDPKISILKALPVTHQGKRLL